MGNTVCARPLAAPSGFARTLLRLCFAKLLASLVGGPDGFAAGASRAQATRRLPARANDARPRNAAGLSCGVPPPERARQRVGQKVVWRLHPVTSVTTRERPSPRAAAAPSQAAMPRVRCAAFRGRALAHAMPRFVVARQRKFFPPRKGFCGIMQTIGHRRIISSICSK